ncbi:MAG: hypothetical protein IBJ12_15200 [Sphingomonadaceae bacterium]|nr:hypothetical protein [Sphingomonadaceae bacterium]
MIEMFRRYYFPAVTFLLLLLTLGAFSDNLFTDVGQPSNGDPKFIVHGLVCGAWMILLFVQTGLIGVRNTKLHRKLGLGAIAIAIGVTLSTVWLFIAAWKGWAAMSPEVKANRFLLPGYTVFIAFALIYRRRPIWHKRLMFTGTLFMLDPVLARVYDPFVVPLFMTDWAEPQIERAFLPWFFCTWLAFFLSLAVYDIATLRRIHGITLLASLWFGLVWIIAFTTEGQPW